MAIGGNRRARLRLADVSRTPSGTFFRELHGWLLDQAASFTTCFTSFKKQLSRCAQPESRCAHRPAPVLSGFLPPKEPSVGRVIGRCAHRTPGFGLRTPRNKILKCCKNSPPDPEATPLRGRFYVCRPGPFGNARTTVGEEVRGTLRHVVVRFSLPCERGLNSHTDAATRPHLSLAL